MTSSDTCLVVHAWADIICPWCYIGEARLMAAIRRSGHPISVTPRAFELDPGHTHAEPVLDMLSRKYGAAREQAEQMDNRVAELARAEGLPYTSERVTANTFDAHRLVSVAARVGRGVEVRHALQRGHFSGEVDLSDRAAMTAAAVAAGLEGAVAAAAWSDEETASAVRDDAAEARALGATGVPFTVLGRRWAIPGCAETEQYVAAIDQAWDALSAEAPPE